VGQKKRRQMSKKEGVQRRIQQTELTHLHQNKSHCNSMRHHNKRVHLFDSRPLVMAFHSAIPPLICQIVSVGQKGARYGLVDCFSGAKIGGGGVLLV